MLLVIDSVDRDKYTSTEKNNDFMPILPVSGSRNGPHIWSLKLQQVNSLPKKKNSFQQKGVEKLSIHMGKRILATTSYDMQN